ncbi:Indole-3-acetic acid-induced protein ARG7 [Bienertia sinuspersici]
MDQQTGGKLTGIRQIVRLKEILQKWQNVTLSSRQPHHQNRPHHGGIAPEVSRRLKKSTVGCDSDEEGCQTPEPPPDVPRGYLAVYVGSELRRFIIPTAYLSHHLFKVLLEKAEEEFGFDHAGGLTIPCEIETFKYLLKCIENEDQHKEEEHSSDFSS